MGLLDRVHALAERAAPPKAFNEASKKPATKVDLTPPTAAQVRRAGYEYGIQLGGTSIMSSSAFSAERLQILQQLYQAYITCPWVSSPIDLIARTATAGGLQIVVDSAQDHEGEIPADPPDVQRLKRLLSYTNPREDMVQMMRSCIIDLLLFGDAFVEVVTLLGEPVALYTLDATTMTVLCDEHGEISGYKQDVDGLRQCEFDTDQVIHISLDAPRGGVYGVSPTQKALLPITAWLFTEATIKECFRRGDPPRLHVDLGSMKEQDVRRWQEQYTVTNLGPKAVGTPVVTTGGGVVTPIDPRKVQDYLATGKQLRDEIISCYGTPPGKLGIIETGNIGSGSGEQQDKSFRVNTIIPVQALVLEKFNFHLVKKGFSIDGWHLEFGEIDFRDSKVVEDIRDMRLRNGSYTLNRYRDEIGEPPIDGGDDAVLIDRQNIVLWADMDSLSKAGVAYKVKDTSLDVSEPKPGEPVNLEKPEPEPPPQPLQPMQPMSLTGGKPLPANITGRDPEARPGGPKDAIQGKGPREDSRYDTDRRKLNESWSVAYAARRKAALKELNANVTSASDVPKSLNITQGPPLPEDPQLGNDSMHAHHDRPDYDPAELGLTMPLQRIIVNPRDTHVDHVYQRNLHSNLVDKYMHNRQQLAEHIGLLAIRPDNSMYVVSGQHHTVAAIQSGLTELTYQSFPSSGTAEEAMVYKAYSEWHKKWHDEHGGSVTDPALPPFTPAITGGDASNDTGSSNPSG